MSDHALAVIATIFGGISALAAVVTVLLMLREARKPASKRHYWPYLVALAVFTIAIVVPGSLAYRLIVESPSMPPLLPGQHYLTDSGGDDNFYEGRPIGVWWGSAGLNGTVSGPTASPIVAILSFTFRAKNLGNEEVSIERAYIVSGLDSTKLPLKIDAGSDGFIDAQDTNPVPPQADFALKVDFPDPSETSFLRTWGHFAVIVECGGKKLRHEITEQMVRSWINQSIPGQLPHVTKRKP